MTQPMKQSSQDKVEQNAVRFTQLMIRKSKNGKNESE
jgi:hypothetical protein